MKLATFLAGGQARIGVADPDRGRLFDIAAAAQAAGRADGPWGSMLALIDGGEAALDALRALLDRYGAEADFNHNLATTRLLAPLPEPRQMRDGMSFETHIRQSGSGRGRDLAAARAAGDSAREAEVLARALPELPEIYRQMPIYYFTNRLAVCGPEATVAWPRYSKVMDYELEFGVITGKRGRDLTRENARDHIFGYTIFNDFSARDQQMLEMQGRLGPAKGKSFENSNALGPYIVTKDEIADPGNLQMTARINGRTVVESTTRGMLFSFEEILVHMTQSEWILPGEFIGSGTVGHGCGLENGWFLSDGDTIELEVEGLGILRNHVTVPKN